MTDTAVLLVPLLVVPVVLVLGFAGCTAFSAAISRLYPDLVKRTGGLVAYWRLSETTGNIANDAGPNALHGTYEGGRTLGVGNGALKAREPEDRCLGLDGTARVAVFEDARLSPPIAFSVAAWVRFPGSVAVPPGKQVLVSGHNRATGDGFVLELDRDPAPMTFQGRTFKDGQESRVQVRPTASEGEPDAWRFVVFTYAAGKLTLHVKIAGVEGIFQRTADGGYAGAGTATAVDIGAGRDDQGQPAFFVVGRMDEVALFNVALTETQVEDLFTAATTP